MVTLASTSALKKITKIANTYKIEEQSGADSKKNHESNIKYPK